VEKSTPELGLFRRACSYGLLLLLNLLRAASDFFLRFTEGLS
jgi:hypothetical protein